MMGLPKTAIKLINETIECIDPNQIYSKKFEFNEGGITFKNKHFPISHKLHLFGLGKSAAHEVSSFRNLISQSPLSKKLGKAVSYTKEGDEVIDKELIQFTGTHPIPSQGNLNSTIDFLKLLESVPNEDSLIFFLSGGASALLELPAEGVSLEDLIQKNASFLKSGMGISDINYERIKLSKVKGGGLIGFIKTTNILQLITCDIPNGNIYDVGSGPLLGVRNPINDEIEKNTIVTMSGSDLLDKMCSSDDRVSGGVFDCSLDELIKHLKNHLPEKGKTHISTGECPISLPNIVGKGGRNTHFVLSMAQEIYSNPQNRDIHILSFATDGGDGNTGCAGAYINYELYRSDRAMSALETFDSYNYFSEIDSLIFVDQTKSNVMDIRFIWRG